MLGYDLAEEKSIWTKDICYINQSYRIPIIPFSYFNYLEYLAADAQLMLWKDDNAYDRSPVFLLSNYLFYTINWKSKNLDLKSGKELWRTNCMLLLCDTVSNVGLAYEYNSSVYPAGGIYNVLLGVDLTNGEILWRRSLDLSKSWDDARFLNDSTLLVVASGVRLINLYNGKGWDYRVSEKERRSENLKPGIETEKLGHSAMLHNALNYEAPESKDHLFFHEDDSAFYYVSKERLSCINKKTGKAFWFKILDKKMESKARFFIKDDRLYLVNHAYKHRGGKRTYKGLPYFSAFNKNTGKQEYITEFDTKKDPIYDYKTSGDTLILLFKNRIAKYNLEDGKLFSEKVFDRKDKGMFLYFVGSNVYRQVSENSFVEFNKNEGNLLNVCTDTKEILAIDRSLNIVVHYPKESIFSPYLSYKGCQFVEVDKHTVILDSSGQKVAELDMFYYPYILGGKLFVVEDKKILEIDWSGQFGD
jgi:outer membrane protein assembly factor BamB